MDENPDLAAVQMVAFVVVSLFNGSWNTGMK